MIRGTKTAAVALASGVVVFAVAWAGSNDAAIPDPELTPGAVATTDRAEICAGGYSKAHRLPFNRARKERIERLYGRSSGELDHEIPLCAGGADVDANLWIQPWDEAREKDRLEAEACRRICAGTVSVTDAQAWFRPDWRVAYERIFGKVP